MKNLEIPVTTIPKIGDKYGKLLEKLGIFTIKDLIYHFPTRYENFANIKKIKDLQPNEEVTIEANVLKIDNVFTKNRKKITKAIVVDSSGELELVWFNQHYLIKSITKGKAYYFSGRVNSFNNKLSLVSPQYELVKENNINTARLVPIYPETAGISSKWLRSRIDFVLNTLLNTDPLEENLPDKLIREESLLEINDAVKKIHFPENILEEDKARERLGFEELFAELIKIEKRKKWRKEQTGIKLQNKKEELDEFISSLPFTLTDSQLDVVEDIYKDLEKKYPMNRLLEGDVGSGKTIVAVIASYLSFLNKHKTIYMAPTEILARQHFESYKNFLDGKNIKVSLHTGSNKTEDLKNSDIIIGTHALLFIKEQLENVGLIIIDEQHRFGVEQRAKLTNIGTGSKKPNILTMTATPIPRTLALTLYGDLDLSVLKEMPNKNKNIKTKVVPEDLRAKTYKWIKSQNKKTFIVCPLIDESESETMTNVKAAQDEYESLKNGVFRGSSIGLLHGRMKNTEKEVVMNDFRSGKYNVLVSTPVIEVGVDIPDAAVMVIESAERYGLASLHQLRGRVGRGISEAYCFLFLSNYSSKGYARLKNLENYNSGLKLAEIDMEYRGEGDVLGTQQHGFKQFKIANLSDLEFLERVKLQAQKYFEELDK